MTKPKRNVVIGIICVIVLGIIIGVSQLSRSGKEENGKRDLAQEYLEQEARKSEEPEQTDELEMDTNVDTETTNHNVKEEPGVSEKDEEETAEKEDKEEGGKTQGAEGSSETHTAEINGEEITLEPNELPFVPAE